MSEVAERVVALISEAVEDGLFFEDKRRGLADDILALVPLDAAWARAEAALPEGWLFELCRRGVLYPEPNPWTGQPVRYRHRYEATAQPTFEPLRSEPVSHGESDRELTGYGDDAAAALTALALLLEGESR